MAPTGKRQARDSLTPRERELIHLMEAGLSNQEIAQSLFLTVGTVKWYLNKIFSKLQVTNRTQAIAAARASEEAGRAFTPENPGKSLPDHYHNLPSQLTSFVFVGRERELEAITRELNDPEVRLISILGPGGSGKSRLTLQVGSSQLGRYPDGVFLASLASLADPELIPSVIIEALGLSLAPGQSEREQLFTFLRDKHLLLILDNFEHLLSGVDLLPQLLQNAPGLKIMVTSRERLHLQSEVIFYLGGFPLRDWTSPQEANLSEAGRLFLQVAQRLKPGFELGAENLTDLKTICRLVEGMPLGILLAAAWVNLLSIEEIAREIERSFDFLEGSLRDLPPRQRSLRAVFEQSWRLLNPAERSAMGALSVFRGSFKREAAEQIGGITLKTLAGLLNKSLLNRAPSGRFELHELLRQFSESQLNQLPEERSQFRTRFVAYYSDFLGSRWKKLRSEQMKETLEEIEVELGNLRWAWKVMVEEGWCNHLAKAAPCLWWFLYIRSQIGEGIELFGQARQTLQKLPPGKERDRVLGEILVDLANFFVLRGTFNEGKALAQESLALLRDLHEDEDEVKEIMVRALIPLGTSEFILGNYQEVRLQAQKVAELAERIRDVWYRHVPYYFQGLAALGSGDFEEAYQAGKLALKYAREAKDPQIQGVCNGMLLGKCAVRLGRYDEAKEYFLQSITFLESIDHKYYTAIITGELSEVYTMLGEYAEAKKASQASLNYLARVAPPYLIFTNLHLVALTLEKQGEYQKAVELLSFMVLSGS